MESVFLRFDSYDFEADRRFQQGLQTLHAGVSGKETNILDAKLFFYNRWEALHIHTTGPRHNKANSTQLPVHPKNIFVATFESIKL